MGTPIEIENSLLPWLGRSMKLVDYNLTDSFKAKGIELSKQQLIMLVILMKNNAQPQNSLAFLTNRDKASLARLVDTMEKKNLVERIPSQDDKRVNLVNLTPIGRSTLQKAFPVMQQVIKAIQKGIPDDDIKIAIRVLKQIVTNVKPVDFNSALNN
jgi:DNA-binding MarR family transcriptional regulator